MNHTWQDSRWTHRANFPQLVSVMASDAVDSNLCVTKCPGSSTPTWTHTLWIKRRGMHQQASPWTERSEITSCTLTKSHPFCSGLTAVPKEMRKHGTKTKYVKMLKRVLVYAATTFNCLCVIETLMNRNIPVISVGYSLFEGRKPCNIILKGIS